MKRAFLFVLLATAPVSAQDTTSSVKAPSTESAVIAPATSTPSFLTSRGVVTSQELVETLNMQLTPEQRAQLEQALAKRNAALAKANNELLASLRDVLRETDEDLTRRVDEGAEARRMEKMRRLQPGRYQHLMNEKKKAEKAAKEAQKAQTTP